jgi:hypothetical protein
MKRSQQKARKLKRQVQMSNTNQPIESIEFELYDHEILDFTIPGTQETARLRHRKG